MEIVEVTTQEQLDLEASKSNEIVVRSGVFIARGNSTVHAVENSTVHAVENSTVLARGNSTVYAVEDSVTIIDKRIK